MFSSSKLLGSSFNLGVLKIHNDYVLVILFKIINIDTQWVLSILKTHVLQLGKILFKYFFSNFFPFDFLIKRKLSGTSIG